MSPRPLFLPLVSCVLSLFLAPPALAAGPAEDVLVKGYYEFELQLIGWSQDEQRFVFRVYTAPNPDLEQDEEERAKDPWRGKDGFCKGFVDHRGKRFRGGLSLVVFEGMKQVASLPIQDDEDTCTPPEVAASRLTEAKKKLAELGIDLTRTGLESPLKKGKPVSVKEGRLAPYALEFEDKTRKDAIEDTEEVRYHGVQWLYVRKGSTRKQLFEKKFDMKYATAVGVVDTESLSQVCVSPSGERVVVLGLQTGESMRGSERTWRVRGLVSLPESLVAEAK